MIKATATARTAARAIGQAIQQPERSLQFELLNEIRQWVYAQQREIGLDLSLSLCMDVQEFCEQCTSKKYRGFRLPENVSSVEAVSIDNRQTPVHSYWRRPYDGIAGTPCDGSVRLIDGGYKPTERDIDCNCPTTLRFAAYNAACAKQHMEVTGVTPEGREESYTYEVTAVTQVGEDHFCSISRVFFPGGVDGVVLLSDQHGKDLARYSDGSEFPKFREFRILGDGCFKQIIVIANCKYRDLVDDCDIVEFGNTLVWKLLAKYLNLLHKPDKNGNDRANLEQWLTTATGLMIQEAAVESNETLDLVMRRKPLTSQSYLNLDRNCRV